MRISVKVQPGSSKEQVVKNPDTGIKVYLKTAPVDGKANAALVKVLSEYFNVAKSKIKLVAGKQSRNKVVDVTR